MTKADIVKNAIRRFNHLGALTIAKHILNTHGDLFNNDQELIRSRVRYYLGRHGDKNRQAADPELFRDGEVEMPQTWRRVRKPYYLKPGLWLVLSDIHVPFHELLPIEAAIKTGQAEQVNGVFLNGDAQDCASVSFWPAAKCDFNKEIEAFIDFLDCLKAHKDSHWQADSNCLLPMPFWGEPAHVTGNKALALTIGRLPDRVSILPEIESTQSSPHSPSLGQGDSRERPASFEINGAGRVSKEVSHAVSMLSHTNDGSLRALMRSTPEGERRT